VKNKALPTNKKGFEADPSACGAELLRDE